MRFLRFAVGITSLLVVSGLLVSVASATSCARLLFWDGVRYDGTGRSYPQHVRFGGQVGEALNPPCNDDGSSEPGCGGEEGEAVPVFRLAGIDPEVAVGARHYGREVYLAAGYFTELPDHPLHMAIFKSPRLPNERAGWRCGPPIPDLPGAVVNETPGAGWVFQVRFEGDRVRRDVGRTALFVDARTRITGFDRNGLPHIVEGDRLRATVLECTASGGRYKVVADSISPA
jgi:hypothetical protein